MLNAYQWPDRSAADLERFERHSARELAARIPGFPRFVLRASSGVPKRRSGCRAWNTAAAHVQSFYAPFLGGMRGATKVWTIEFNDRHPWLFDMELVLYHELAHFMARRIELFTCSHGLLWATCCDALMLHMNLDPDSCDEGTDYIFKVDAGERWTTFRAEHIADEAHWRLVRARTRARVAALLAQAGPRIGYDDLLAIIRVAHRQFAPKPPPPAPKRRRAARKATA